MENCSEDSVLARLVSKPSVVTMCNVLHRPVLPHLGLGVQPCLVLTRLCIEFAITCTDHLYLVLRNISFLLKTSGILITIGGLNESFYMLGEQRFPALAFTRELMETALEEACMKWKESKRSSDPQRKQTGHSGVYFMWAKKN